MSLFTEPVSSDGVSASAPVVLSVAFPFAVVGEAAVGGAEVVLSQVEAALPAMGFRSVVVAREGSRPVGPLYPTPGSAEEIDDRVRAEVERAQQANLDRALAEHPVALVHMHSLDFARYRLPPEMPVVVTLHLPPGWYPPEIWDLPANYHFVCVSETQRAACPEGTRHRLRVIGNGVALPGVEHLRPGGRYALMLSRICPEKNLHTGLDAARAVGMPALLAGEVFPYREHLRYFAEEIEPRLTAQTTGHTPRGGPAGPEVRFLGPVTGAAKTRLLCRAACLLLPSVAPETSSLAAMEALAAGVPVIGVASGAVPEVVAHGTTGWLVPPARDMVAHLAAALGHLPSLSRAACRTEAEQRFSLQAMLQQYAALYRELLQTRPAQTVEPGVETRDLQMSVLRGVEQLAACERAWACLWERDPTASPFQHPGWLLPWAHQFGPDGEVLAVAQRTHEGALVGVLPLFLYTEPNTKITKALLLGTGTTDYLGGVFAPAAAGRELASTALQFALWQLPRAQVFDLLQLRGDSPLLAAGSSLPARQHGTAEACATLPLSRPLPPKLAANVRRYRHRAEAMGSVEVAVAQSPEEALAWFEMLVQFHGERWEEAGVLRDPRVLGHHREALPALLAAGVLRLFRLQCHGRTLAVLYALADAPQRPGRRLYLYLIGTDKGQAELSPGTLILHEVWMYARRHGFAVLDLLRGGERYKELWGAVPDATGTLRLVRS